MAITSFSFITGVKAEYALTLIQDGQLSVSGERMHTSILQLTA